MRVDAEPFNSLNLAPVKEPRYVVGIIYDVDSIYITSHTDIPNVPGTVINGALKEPTVVSQRLKPDVAVAEIGSASFSLVDLAAGFTDEVRERLGDGSGLRHKPVRFYLGYAGLDFTEFKLVATQIVQEPRYKDLGYSVSCLDIQRTLKTDIFDPRTTTLTASVSATDTTINVHDNSLFEMLQHGTSYTDAPSSTVGYLKIKDEIIRYTGKTSGTFTGCTRGVFGTTAAAYTVDAGTAQDRREKVSEYIYLELPGPKLAYAILTGVLWEDGATLPSNWHLNIDPVWVTEDDFTGIGVDKWDLTNDNVGFKVRFEGLAKTSGKTFLEKELYLLMGLYSPVYADGSLGLRRMTRIGSDAATVMTLDETNSISVGELQHDMDSLHNIFEVNWNYVKGEPTRTTTFADVNSYTTHGRSDVYSLSFKGLYGGVHTDSTIFQMLDGVRDRYAGPPLRLNVELFHSCNRIEIGDVVRVRYAHVRDFTKAGASLDRAAEVQHVSVNHRTGRVSVELFMSTADASVSPPTTAATSLPDAYYVSDGTALSAVPGVTIASNVLTAAPALLTGHADLNNAAAIYYHDDDLTIGAGVTLNIAENVQLRVRGFMQCNGAINGVGRGHAGAVDDGRILLQDHVTAWVNEYIWTNPDGTPWVDGVPYPMLIPGNPGFLGHSRACDGIYDGGGPFNTPGIGYLETLTAAHAVGLNNSVPMLDPLRVVGSTLEGLPPDCRGTGGPPGGRGYTLPIPPTGLSREQLGGAGGAGGAGLVLVSRGFAFGVNGSINLSGADGTANTTLENSTVVASTQYYAGTGGPGCPGAFYLLLDGANFSEPDLSRCIARIGDMPLFGTPLPGRYSSVDTIMMQAQSPWRGADSDRYDFNRDMASDARRIQYIPAPETATPDEDSRPPPPTALSASSQVGGILLDVTAPPIEQWDVIEIYAAASNDRTGATLVNRIRSTTYQHSFPTATTRYYWVRTRRDGITSEWFPTSSTGGIDGTSTSASSGSAGESAEIQFSVDGSTSWHGTFTTGDLYMRTRVGSSGTWQGPWRIVGEAGAAGAAGGTGNFIDIIFKRSATQPATPTGNTPATWSDGVPAYDGNPVWMSSGEKTASNVLVGTWSVPQALAADGLAYWMITSAAAVQRSIAGVYTPTSVAFNGYFSSGISAPVAYSGRYIIATSTDGTTYTTQYTSSADEGGVTYTVPAGIKTIRARLYLAGGTTTLIDEEIIPIVNDGATGSTGSTGSTGATGSTGNYKDFVFRRAAVQPATPTGASPSGWSTGVPAYDGNPVWMSSADKTSAGALVGAWTTPQLLAVDGDRTNLLNVAAWALANPLSSNPGNWLRNETTAGENAIVLGGTGGAPLGPFGTSELLWECRASGDGNNDGGWNNGGDLANIDYTKTYRSTVWVRFNRKTGNLYHGCGDCLDLGGSSNTNPYFSAVGLGSSALLVDKWYLMVGIIHGNSYGTTDNGVSGIYDPISGRRVVGGTEFKMAASAQQMHRAYHFYDSDAAHRQWFAAPRFEAINGNEPTIYELMGLRQATPWLERGNCVASDNAFTKIGGASAWDSDVQSIRGYQSCYLTFKPSQTNMHLMVGFNADPNNNQSYDSIDFAFNCDGDGTLRIYESGAPAGSYGSYTTSTECAITYDGANVRYYKDRVLLRTVALAGATLFLDSSFYTPGASVNSVRFGPGSTLPVIDTVDIAPDAATVVRFASNIGPVVSTPDNSKRGLTSLTFVADATGVIEVTGNAEAYSNWPDGGFGRLAIEARINGAQYGWSQQTRVMSPIGEFRSYAVLFSFPVAFNDEVNVTFFSFAGLPVPSGYCWSENINLRATLVKK